MFRRNVANGNADVGDSLIADLPLGCANSNSSRQALAVRNITIRTAVFFSPKIVSAVMFPASHAV